MGRTVARPLVCVATGDFFFEASFGSLHLYPVLVKCDRHPSRGTFHLSILRLEGATRKNPSNRNSFIDKQYGINDRDRCVFLRTLAAASLMAVKVVTKPNFRCAFGCGLAPERLTKKLSSRPQFNAHDLPNWRRIRVRFNDAI